MALLARKLLRVPGTGYTLDLSKLDDPETSAEDKQAIVETLEELDRLYEENPLHKFEPHPKQEPFLSASTSVKAFLGGNRSGKTTAGIVDDLIQAVDEKCLPPHLKAYKHWQPPFHCRIVTPDFTSTMEGVVFEKLREWAPKHQLLGGSWEKAYDKQLRKLRFRNGSRFDFMTFEQDLDKFGGAALTRVHYDEEPPESIRKECQARLLDKQGDELFTMTPLLGMTWMFDEIYERREEPSVTVVQVATDDNPHLDPRTLEDYFSRLSPEERDARRLGQFVHFGGLVLRGFTDHLHVIDPISPEHLDGQTVIVGIDPGVVRGAVVWCAFDRDDMMLVFDELYPQNMDVAQLAQEIQAKNNRWGRPAYYVIDPSGRNRTMTGTVAEEFQRRGIPAINGKNDREAGVIQLRRRLSASPPGLLVTSDCTSWLWEKSRWRIAEDEESGQDKTGGDSFKTAGPDHLMDATRYVAMERVWAFPERPQKLEPTAWVPGTAPSEEWFNAHRREPETPMGSYT